MFLKFQGDEKKKLTSSLETSVYKYETKPKFSQPMCS